MNSDNNLAASASVDEIQKNIKVSDKERIQKTLSRDRKAYGNQKNDSKVSPQRDSIDKKKFNNFKYQPKLMIEEN